MLNDALLIVCMVATVGVVALSLHAYVTHKLDEVRVAMVEHITKIKYNERRSNDNSREILKLRESVHSLKGANSQVLEYLKSND